MARLAEHLVQRPTLEQPAALFKYLADLRQIQGNVSNDLSALACLLAKEYLWRHHALAEYDSTSKPQGARGLDVDLETTQGQRIVAEIKTTVPLYGDEFGAAQEQSILSDLGRLRRTRAEFKYFFVTSAQTRRVLEDKAYARELRGIELVLVR